MGSRLIGFSILVVIFVFLDYYNLGGLQSLADAAGYPLLSYVYIALSVVGMVGTYVGISQLGRSPIDRGAVLNWLVGFAFVMIVVRLVFAGFLLLQDVWRAISSIVSTDTIFSERSTIYLSLALVITAIPLLAMLFGISFGKYRYRVEELTLTYPDLPAAFDGFKLVQISDIHSGSWDSIDKVKSGLDLVQKQQGDVILFTGDIVNSDKDEIDPFIDSFSALYAPFGKYAILGNHDYYGQPRDAALRPAYYQDFFDKFKRMGWDLILNDHRTISINDADIQLIGVENWGHGRYFPKRGDLDKAIEGVPEDDFSILLSHDPTHWDLKVKDHPRHIHLTLSGHTHGMQFGINLKNFKWSPVQYRYKKWIGKYLHNDQVLYINRGFGYLGFPGRVGMWPEITVITLRRKKE